MSTTRRFIAMVIAFVALATAFAAPAFAEYWQDSRSTTGAWANCGITTSNGLVRDQYARITCSLKDTACDSHSVYVQWWQDGYGKVRLNNTSGCNTTRQLGDSRYSHDPFIALRWRVCRDVQWGDDNCSSTVSHYTY